MRERSGPAVNSLTPDESQVFVIHTFLPLREPCCPLHTLMAVISTTGRFNFCRSASGIRHSTARVSGFTPGGRGVGTPGFIGSLGLDEAVVGVAMGVVTGRGLLEGRVVVVCGIAVVSSGTEEVSVVVSGSRVVVAALLAQCTGLAVEGVSWLPVKRARDVGERGMLPLLY